MKVLIKNFILENTFFNRLKQICKFHKFYIVKINEHTFKNKFQTIPTALKSITKFYLYLRLF